MSDPVRISGFFSTFDTESVISQLTQVRMNAVTLLEVCGAAFRGIGIPAVIASGQAAARRLLGGTMTA